MFNPLNIFSKLIKSNKKNFSYIADRAMIEFAKLERNWKNKVQF